MPKLSEHPTVKKVAAAGLTQGATPPQPLDAGWLRQLVLEAGADDVGFVGIDRSELDDQRDEIRLVFPQTRAVISYVVKMNKEAIRTPYRSISNHEFHSSGEDVNNVGRAVVARLAEHGVRAVTPPMAFPMEVGRFPDQKPWVISHKPIAVAAGLGHMGIHRNVIHPQFGNFILLGTVLVAAEVTEQQQPLDYNPCLECKLCVAACPVGAIGSDGWFDFNACLTHNYREFLGGFRGWVEDVADSRNAAAFSRKETVGETVSMWQSLAFGPNYKAAYCLAVCPAGEDVITPYLVNKADYLRDVVKPLQEKVETIYVSPGSDAETHVHKRFAHKKVKRVNNGVSVTSLAAFSNNLVHFFQRGKSQGLNAVYHFDFSGQAPMQFTVTIRDQHITKEEGLLGQPNLRVKADGDAWVNFLNRRLSGGLALATGKIRIHGDPRLLIAFGNCFPF